MYQVVHCYDTDGGFGDAVSEERVVAVFEDEDDAKAFISKFEKPHVYFVPYDELMCGTLEPRELEVISHDSFNIGSVDTSEFWWLQKSMWEEMHEKAEKEESAV